MIPLVLRCLTVINTFLHLGLLLTSAMCTEKTVSQKKDIKRQKDRLEALKKESTAEKARAKEAARERVLADFERGQLGLGSNVSGSVISTSSTEGAPICSPSEALAVCFFEMVPDGRGSGINLHTVISSHGALLPPFRNCVEASLPLEPVQGYNRMCIYCSCVPL